jgi:hypothetical protein
VGLLLLEVRNCLSRGSAPVGRGSDGSFPCSQGGANRAPLAPAKVLREDASIPTRRRSSRALRAGGGTTAAASGGSQGAAEASRPRLVTSPTGPQPAVAEVRRAPAVVEAQQATAATGARPEA